tara:strand:+ start:142 stop:534 length:393 start_codon:yes stop_codon:yes gene_type:complete
MSGNQKNNKVITHMQVGKFVKILRDEIMSGVNNLDIHKLIQDTDLSEELIKPVVESIQKDRSILDTLERKINIMVQRLNIMVKNPHHRGQLKRRDLNPLMIDRNKRLKTRMARRNADRRKNGKINPNDKK